MTSTDTDEGVGVVSESTDEVLDGFRNLSPATISDALDRVGLRGTTPGLLPLFKGERLVGRAFTARYVPNQEAGATVGEFIDEVEAGQIVVIDNNGRLDCTVWGALMTIAASRRGLSGAVIHGVCRDTSEAFDRSFPMYTRGRHMSTGKDRVSLAGVQIPIDIGGIQVQPGDVVVGDYDGIVVVPREWDAHVLQEAAKVRERERSIIADILSGKGLAEARRAHGYHNLQRGEPTD